MPQSSSEHSKTKGQGDGTARFPVRRCILLLLGLSLALAMIAVSAFYHDIVRPGPAQDVHTIIVERGETVGRIADRLESQGSIRSAWLFRWTVRLLGAEAGIRAGEFRLSAGLSLYETLDVLRFGEPVLRRLTVPEGLTSAQIVTLLAEIDGLKGTLAVTPEEGSLLPETYFFAYGDTRRMVVQRMQQAQDELLDRLWPTRANALPFSTKHEAVTLASIVEKETGIETERALVASVFINRLKRGMRLQSDPTVIYGISAGKSLKRPILRSELDAETPFNTYRISGLPPHPIANPGREAIAAVLNPAETAYLYFVADGNGGHAFAETLAEHNRNVRAWRRLRQDTLKR